MYLVAYTNPVVTLKDCLISIFYFCFVLLIFLNRIISLRREKWPHVPICPGLWRSVCATAPFSLFIILMDVMGEFCLQGYFSSCIEIAARKGSHYTLALPLSRLTILVILLNCSTTVPSCRSAQSLMCNSQ